MQDEETKNVDANGNVIPSETPVQGEMPAAEGVMPEAVVTEGEAEAVTEGTDSPAE